MAARAARGILAALLAVGLLLAIWVWRDAAPGRVSQDVATAQEDSLASPRAGPSREDDASQAPAGVPGPAGELSPPAARDRRAIPAESPIESETRVRVEGRVLDPLGIPAPGAQVWAAADLAGGAPIAPALGSRVVDAPAPGGPVRSDEDREVAETLSGPEGGFHLELPLPRGVSLAVGAEVDGASTVRRGLEPDPETDVLDVTLSLDPRLEARGRVVEETGAPVPGARVRIRPTLERGAAWREVRTGPEGTFSCPCREGNWGLEIEVEASGMALLHEENRPCGADLGTFRLRRGVTVHGVVREDTGLAIEGARVAWDPRVSYGYGQDVFFPEDSPRETLTDATGAYVLEDLPWGRIHVRATGVAHSVATELLDVAAGEDREQDFTLRRIGTIAGIVVDRETGAPIEGASVLPAHARTGPDGRFVAKRLVVPTDCVVLGKEPMFWLKASAGGYRTAGVELPCDTTREEVRLELDRAGVVQGVVADRDGRPVPGASVSLRGRPSGTEGLSSLPPSVPAGGDGAFRIEAPPGSYERIEVRFGWRGRKEFEGVEIAAGQIVTRRLVVDTGLAVRGRVVARGSRQPLAGHKVAAFRISPNPTSRPEDPPQTAWQQERLSRGTRSDARGQFVLRGLSPGRAWIVAAAGPDGFSGTAVEIEIPAGGAPPPVVELSLLGPGLTIEGIITDTSGQPLPGATVHFRPESEDPRVFLPASLGLGARADGDGRFLCPGLPAVPLRWFSWPPPQGYPELLIGPKGREEPPFSPLRIEIRSRQDARAARGGR